VYSLTPRQQDSALPCTAARHLGVVVLGYGGAQHSLLVIARCTLISGCRSA
jgi:hypothetical protein